MSQGSGVEEAIARVAHQLGGWAHTLGFSQIGVADVDLSQAEQGLLDWLAAGFHGEMGYMQAHGLKRASWCRARCA
jgi:epoxyqueuosine reductase